MFNQYWTKYLLKLTIFFSQCKDNSYGDVIEFTIILLLFVDETSSLFIEFYKP